MRTSFKVKGKGQGRQADIMLRPEVRHIFLGEQIEDEDPYRHDGPSMNQQQGQRLRSRCHVLRLTGVGH